MSGLGFYENLKIDESLKFLTIDFENCNKFESINIRKYHSYIYSGGNYPRFYINC